MNMPVWFSFILIHLFTTIGHISNLQWSIEHIGLVAQVARAQHRYHWGTGLISMSSQIFSGSFSTVFKIKVDSCQDRKFHLCFIRSWHIWFSFIHILVLASEGDSFRLYFNDYVAGVLNCLCFCFCLCLCLCLCTSGNQPLLTNI